MSEHIHKGHNVSALLYHFVCPTKYRRAVVTDEVDAVIKDVMLSATVDGEFTTTQDVAEAALFFASFESNALTGQSLVVSHGWHMQ